MLYTTIHDIVNLAQTVILSVRGMRRVNDVYVRELLGKCAGSKKTCKQRDFVAQEEHGIGWGRVVESWV